MSGDPYLIIESGVVTPGSMNRFLKGKMYSCCRKGHILLSTALHGLHFQPFIMDADTDICFTDELNVLLETKSDQLPLLLMGLSN